MARSSTGVTARTPYFGFAVFGAFWGVWGASVPAVRDQAGVTDGQLGTALLFVGAGALPAMQVAGRAVDRWGHRATAVLLVSLGAAGVLLAAIASDLWTLSAGLALVGASSGAADVGINSAAGSVEQATTRPVITRSHAVFSAAVVFASLVAGLMHGVGAPVVTPFLLVGLAAAAAGAIVALDAGDGVDEAQPPGVGQASRPSRPSLRLLPLLVVGVLAALAFAVENAHQSWSAVYLVDVLDAGAGVAAAGPAVFAAVVAVTRFAVSTVHTRHASAILVTGSAAAAAGTAVVATASNVLMAQVGLSLAAAGTAVLFPTLLSIVARHTDERARGAATSVVTTVAYLGFLAGPVYVGRWADAVELPGAMFAVAALAALLAVLSWPVLRALAAGPAQWASRSDDPPRPSPVESPRDQPAQ
ncbi:MAG: MFS transporter [Nocardioidaceae bacterium]|nr:MFS transporter [Nocardioidaceae bacterium]